MSNWKDSASYETEHYEAGINAEIAPNLTLRVAAQHKKNSNNTEAVASINYSVPLVEQTSLLKLCKMETGQPSSNPSERSSTDLYSVKTVL
jgi:hypothetical protein